ncbi:MAG: ATP-binding protein [Cyanobacteria bacterium P01_H01_bin.58]
MQEQNANNELHTQIQYCLIEKLTESERRYRELVENLHEVVFECDQEGNLTFVNQAWTKTLGYSIETSLGQPLKSFICTADIQTWQSLLAHQSCLSPELRFCHETGEIRWLELSIHFNQQSNFSGSLIDITERKRAAMLLKQTNEDLEDRVQQRTQELTQANRDLAATLEQLQQAQGRLIQQEKMSALGQLVAGVAHEINNPINFIQGNVAYIENYVQDLLGLFEQYQQCYPSPVADIQAAIQNIDFNFIQEDLPKTLASMKMGSDRISQIVTSLRNFSRVDEKGIKSADIHAGLNNTLVILNHRLKPHAGKTRIQVSKKYAALPMVECYPGLLNQVFMNILTNAIDALENPLQEPSSENSDELIRKITLKTSLIGDQWVQIEIADNGSGIPYNIQQRIFEPFFTTKSVGTGTGMGLSISHQIITEQHGGTLDCVSSPGKGAQFIIRIPLK